jgi:hypothetical protein
VEENKMSKETFITEHAGATLDFCPVCGCTTKIFVYEHEGSDKDDFDATYYGINCDNCGTTGPLRDTIEDAVAHWNLGLLRGDYDTWAGWMLHLCPSDVEKYKGTTNISSIRILLPGSENTRIISFGPDDLKDIKPPTTH